MANSKPLDATVIKALFARYEEEDEKVSAAKQVLLNAETNRSDIVKMIADAIAPSKQITYKGKTLTIVVRNNTKINRETHFFRGASDKEVVVIE